MPQTLIDLSWPGQTIRVPLAKNATASTSDWWPVRVANRWPLSASHSITDLWRPPPPETRRLPSGDQFAETTYSRWPENVLKDWVFGLQTLKRNSGSQPRCPTR